MIKNPRFIAYWFEPAHEYHLISQLFLKLLALIYFAAFYSLSVQITGLVGAEGILPFKELLANNFERYGYHAWWYLPTLFWLNASDLALEMATWLGCAFSVLLLLGYWQRLSLIVLFALYLSLAQAGQLFLDFQWDYLLLEAGFLAIFLVGGGNRLIIFLFHWLLFRLRFMSGFFKLASGDQAWSGLDALKYYFETQPLPHIGAWWAHQLPELLLKIGAALVLFSELIVPFFIFLPRRYRIWAAGITIVIQLLIIATSNHNFINLLTILLCLFLLDDKWLKAWIPEKGLRLLGIHAMLIKSTGAIKNSLSALFASLILLTSLSFFYQTLAEKKPVSWVHKLSLITHQYGLGNIYHVFPTMQLERHELQIEGSLDGQTWLPYAFKYKPGNLSQAPAFIVPHQPRLDWMIWFVPAQNPATMHWFHPFMMKLWEGSEPVTGLLVENPFANQRPRWLRVLVYRYHFTDKKQRKETGQWWHKEYLGVFPHVNPRSP